MIHTSWEGSDGAPQAIGALAQTPDGLLWLGSRKGLYTFDGLSYSQFQPGPGSSISHVGAIHFLLVSKAGDLWGFGYHGPPWRIHNGQVTVYDRVDQAAIEVMGYPREDSKGTLWAVLNERSLVKLGSDGIWHMVADPARGHGHITMLFIDSRDTLWLVDDDRLFRRPLMENQFAPTNTYVYGWACIGEGQEQDLWITSSGVRTSPSPVVTLQHIDPLGRPASPPPRIRERLASLVTAADGSLWVLTLDNRLLHLGTHGAEPNQHTRNGYSVDTFPLSVGAETMGDHAFIKGSDGSIWVGGMGGLEHFATATLVPAMSKSRVGEWASCVDSSGHLWVSSPTGRLFYSRESHLDPIPDWHAVDNLFCSDKGQIGLTDDSGIAVLRHDRLIRLPLLPGLHGYGNHYIFTGLMQAQDGKIIAAAAGGAIGYSLWIFENGKWNPFLSAYHLPEVASMFQDENQRLYLGFRNDKILVLENGAVRTLSTGRPGIGGTTNFAATSYGVFASGLNGIAIQEGNAFRRFTFAKPEHATVVTGLVEAKNRDLWINGTVGIVRIAASEVQEAVRDPTHRIVSINLQEGNFVGPSFPGMFSHSANKDLNGILWFSTLNGVVSVNPDRLQSTAPPQLSIRSMEADGHPLRADGTFPTDVGTLRIEYIGVDLTHPRAVTYRYRLEGLDSGWQDVGTRTEAIYTHPRPGTYSFQVMAENAYGVWTAPLTSVSFVIPPHFYQTLWFDCLCLCLLTVLLALAVRARVAFVAAGIRARAEERADERISIARDLHDTLLQGVQGLLLNFHSAAERVPADHESKRALEKALATADRIIVEGRDRVKGLRSLDLTDKELCPAIESLGADLSTSGHVPFTVVCSRSEKILQPHIATEVFLIAREAIINAFRHAQASRITVHLQYGKRRFIISIIDNGRGFEAEALKTSEGHGHWGLQGMMERAVKLGASFDYQSAPGQGTAIRLTLKAKRAYE